MQNSSLQHMTKFVPRIMLNWSTFLIMQGAMGELVSVEHLFSLHSPIIEHDVPQSVHQLLIQRCFVHLCVFLSSLYKVYELIFGRSNLSLFVSQTMLNQIQKGMC